MNGLAHTAPLKILVVEDNPGDFLLLKESIYLSKIAIADIQLVETLTAAIQWLQQHIPDIVFLDLHLPDGDGLDTFEQVKEYATGSAVIILSGMADTGIALDAIALGAQDYLDKGEFDEKLLRKTITYSIERRRSLEKLRIATERYHLVSKATHDLVWDWDLLTDEIYRDEEAVKKVYGFSSNAAIGIISEWNKHIHPGDAATLSAMVQEIKTSSCKDFFEIEYKFLTESGEYKNIYDRGYIVRNAEGKPVRLIGAAQDVTEKRKLEAALEKSRLQQQRSITEATIKGQENEREQLGKELHDNVNQLLAASRLYLDNALSAPDVRKDMILKCREFIVTAIDEIRKLSHTLLPPSFRDFGLTSGLSKLAVYISEAAGLRICRDWDAFAEEVLHYDQKLTIYRIVQEQLNNIIKHAEANHVKVSLCIVNNGEYVQLLIKDDGKGFDPSKKRNGVGLRNIMSRAEIFNGSVTIQSCPGNGCELKVVFPIMQP
ncbi:ATP-binding response regulator [Terrimonas pollutisoli]|uniref:ATP-binding response regulator n=1 Tax=Terrimonas pollutisoli TaxID=3034147 RepID=UPI0023EB3B97|nr:response regulator [Terrimonas sp. H1YJ31]